MKAELPAHNARCREWAGKQPAKYRDALLAFCWPCDTETLSYSQTMDDFSKNTAKIKYPGKYVSRATLFRHLKVFKAEGLIKVETRRDGDEQLASVYTMNMNAVIGEPDREPPKVANEPARSRLAKRVEPVITQQYPIAPGDDDEDTPERREYWRKWNAGEPL